MAETIQDDELRLIFICCHPALAPDARIALTLREVGGLTTEEIARAYLTPRANHRAAHRPGEGEDPRRGDSLRGPGPRRVAGAARERAAGDLSDLQRGLCRDRGPSLTRADLCAEAIRLGRLVVELLDEPEALGLLALMLLHEARRAARVDAAGDLVLLEDQDRSLWDRRRIAEAQGLIERAFAARRVGPYVLQAAIAAVHAEAPSAGETDWAQIVALYDVLVRVEPSPVVALNRAVAARHARRARSRARGHRSGAGTGRPRRLPPGPRRARRHAAEARPAPRRASVLPTRS